MHAQGEFHTIDSPRAVPGAIGVLRIVSGDLPELGQRLSMRVPELGAISLTGLCGLDTGVAARVSQDSVLFMPHGGVGIVQALTKALTGAGVPLVEQADPLELYPEALDVHEARVLCALARCRSPLGVDLLLAQGERWRKAGEGGGDVADPRLDRLIHPPTVVVIGKPNIGKSSLLNALAQESVALVADESGTTLDHVGVMLDLGGLALRWIDGAGIARSPDSAFDRAEELLRSVVDHADLIVHAFDALDDDPESIGFAFPDGVQVLRVATRTDRGGPVAPCDAACSAASGAGIGATVSLIRDTLVPPGALADPRPWRFWSV